MWGFQITRIGPITGYGKLQCRHGWEQRAALHKTVQSFTGMSAWSSKI